MGQSRKVVYFFESEVRRQKFVDLTKESYKISTMHLLPKVSVIMPSYNSEAYIGSTLNSILSQNYPNIEVLIADGGSTDGTRNIVDDYISKGLDINYSVITPDQGPSHGRLTAIKLARGKYIAFLDSDDLWENQKLAKQVDYMELRHLDFTFTDYRIIDEENNIDHRILSGHDINNFNQYLSRRGIANSSVMVRRSIIGAVWDDAILNIHGEDTFWWLKLMKVRDVCATRLPEVLLYYRKHPKGRSSQRLRNQLSVWRIYRLLGLTRRKTLHHYFYYCIDVLIRRYTK